jgi:hypothetical protein
MRFHNILESSTTLRREPKHQDIAPHLPVTNFLIAAMKSAQFMAAFSWQHRARRISINTWHGGWPWYLRRH